MPWVFHKQAIPEYSLPTAVFLPWAFPDQQSQESIFPDEAPRVRARQAKLDIK